MDGIIPGIYLSNSHADILPPPELTYIGLEGALLLVKTQVPDDVRRTSANPLWLFRARVLITENQGESLALQRGEEVNATIVLRSRSMKNEIVDGNGSVSTIDTVSEIRRWRCPGHHAL